MFYVPDLKSNLITFIDDYSLNIWVYFLQEKSEAFTVFRSFKARVEKEYVKCIQTLRTDRGGEFNSHDFASFCELHGIQRQLTAAYTPQQNGVAERKNQTIMNMVRSMMVKKDIPKTFWDELERSYTKSNSYLCCEKHNASRSLEKCQAFSGTIQNFRL